MKINVVTHVLALVVGTAAGLAVDDIVSPDGSSAEIAENALFAAAGGVLTYGFKFFTDRQKRTRDALDRRVEAIESLIRSYAEKGVSYWTRELSDNDGRALESEIKGLRKRIAAEVSALKSAGFDCGIECRKELIELYQAVTDGDFEGPGRGRIEIRRTERIFDAANAAVARMRNGLNII